MRLLHFSLLLFLPLFLFSPTWSSAATDNVLLEQSVSETLDLWREGRYEQLFDRLTHRGRISKERFVIRMRETSVRPACCWQKMQNFEVLNVKKSEATVYVKINLEGAPNSIESSTREFQLTHESGIWKMQLADISALAGTSGKKSRHSRKSLSY